MTSRFTAIVEQGRLRPTVPMELPDGTAVEVFILAPDASGLRATPAQILAEIAALPSEPVDPTTSARHDDILYGREAHP
jgi:hypothetical protein